METKHLKKYAPEARRDFIKSVAQKAAVYGLLPQDTLPMQEEGDVVIIGDRPFPRSVARQRKELEARIAREGYQSFIEAIAYTWFNRFVAIRFMELHGYLSHGYRVLSHPSGGSLPEVMEYAERLDLPGLDRDTVIDLKLDGQKDELLYQMLITAQCNELHAIMPFMFEKVSDATELLLPDNLLHSESLIRHLVAGLPPESLDDIEAVGWLYQFYISEKKDDVFAALKKGKKITPENIPAATQLFTPHWIVRYLVENSLGRLWMLNHPESRLIEQMDYYIQPEEPETDFLQISSPEEIKICDPACGSGHMLTYAFDLLYAIYEEQGYQATDIPRLILTHNLYGIEIDQRAGALAAFALTMKAREKYRRFLTQGKVVQPNICVLENIQIDPEDLSAYMDNVGRDLFSGSLKGVVNQWQEADNFGSLIRPLVTDVSEVLELLRDRQMGEDLFLQETHQKVLKALKQADYLSPKYHVVIANPPYMGQKGMNASLKDFLRSNYDDGRADLMTSFMIAASDLSMRDGYWGMINLPSWMFLICFEDLRRRIVRTQRIQSFLHLGRGIFGSDFGSVAYTMQNSEPGRKQIGHYRRLFEQHVHVRPVGDIETLFRDEDYGVFRFAQANFEHIPGCPIGYWAPPSVVPLFEVPSIREIAISEGINKTTDNDRFIRYHWEVSRASVGQDKRWLLLTKGGDFRKWYGNIEEVIDWSSEARRYYKENHNARITPEKLWYERGVTWTKISSGPPSFRLLPSDVTYETAGASIMFESEAQLRSILCFTNTIVSRFLLSLINPTLSLNVENIRTLPDLQQAVPTNTLNELSERLLQISKEDWDAFEVSFQFSDSPMIRNGSPQQQIAKTYTLLRENWDNSVKAMHELEERNNSVFIVACNLESDFTPNVPKHLVTLGSNPYYRYGSDKSESELEALLLADTMREFISYAVGCMLGRYSLDKPGLILANQGETADDYRRQIPEPTFTPDEDNIIPLLDGDWFTDEISLRFQEFLKVTFGTEHFEENLAFLENALYPENLAGKKRKTIRDYFLKDFYNHHLKLYKKRPIYWLFSSGKQGAFKALIYMHRYNPSTLSRMRTEYVVPLQGKFNARIEQLDNDIAAASNTSHRKKLESERTTLIRQHEEIQTFDEKLRHYADQRIEFDLDDGVKENYGKFGDLLAEVKAITGKKPKVEVQA